MPETLKLAEPSKLTPLNVSQFNQPELSGKTNS